MRDIMLIQLYEEGARPLTGKGTVCTSCPLHPAGAEQAVRGTSGFYARMFFSLLRLS